MRELVEELQAARATIARVNALAEAWERPGNRVVLNVSSAAYLVRQAIKGDQ